MGAHEHQARMHRDRGLSAIALLALLLAPLGGAAAQCRGGHPHSAASAARAPSDAPGHASAHP